MKKKNFFNAGYLSDKAPEHIQFFNTRLFKLREFYEELNVYACEIRERMIAPKGARRLRGLFAILIWNRILDAYQCILILSERGAGDEARGLLRAVLESLFLIEANEHKTTFAIRYLNEDQRHVYTAKKRELHASTVAKRLGKKQFRSEIERRELRATIATMGKEIQKRNKRRKPPKQCKSKHQRKYGPFENAGAAGAGMLFEYDKSYQLLCLYTHTSPSGNLEKYLRKDSDAKTTNFVVGPTYELAEITMIFAMEYLLLALFSLNRFFSLGEKVVLEKYWEKVQIMDELAAKMPPIASVFEKIR